MTKDEKKDHAKLQELVRDAIKTADKDAPISPLWIATRVIKKIDPPMLHLAAHYALREIARSILRERAAPSPIGDRKEVTEQLDLPGFELLHDKYPKPDGSGYILIESMTIEEAEWNADQLEKMGRAAIAHAHQLRRWISTRRRAS